jgi:hypothetical protein
MDYRRPGFLDVVVWFVAIHPVVAGVPSFACSLLLLQLRPCVKIVLLLLSTLLRLATIPMITVLHWNHCYSWYSCCSRLSWCCWVPVDAGAPAIVGVLAITDIPTVPGVPAVASDFFCWVHFAFAKDVGVPALLCCKNLQLLHICINGLTLISGFTGFSMISDQRTCTSGK